MGMGKIPRCQHLKVNGTQCGSPALRSRRLCFFHNNVRAAKAEILADTSAPRMFDLPLLEDANSVQMALMKVIQMLGSEQMDHRTAGLMLYALQTASSNLRNVNLEVRYVTDVVINPENVHRTDIGGPQWSPDNFVAPTQEDEEEAHDAVADETKDEVEDEDTVAAAPAQAQAVRRAPAKLNHVSTEEARMQVQGVVRNWLLESTGGNVEAKPD